MIDEDACENYCNQVTCKYLWFNPLIEPPKFNCFMMLNTDNLIGYFMSTKYTERANICQVNNNFTTGFPTALIIGMVIILLVIVLLVIGLRWYKRKTNG